MLDSKKALSFRGRRWREPEVAPAAIEAIMPNVGNRILARLLAARGVTPETVASFLNPMIKDLMPDPYRMADMEKAATRLADAIGQREKIGIWSDYDADGATAAATFGRFLRLCGHRNFVLRIPDRIAEGYGPNTPGLLALGREGCNPIFTLDSGIVAFEPLAAARVAGIDVVVIDHHAAEAEIPQAVAVVNPNRHDDSSGLGHLCAAGVTFMLAVATTRILGQRGYFDGKNGRPAGTPPLMSLLDLVALGTVADVVPLKGLNRAFVAKGLPWLTRRGTPGIAALADVAAIAEEITERDCGWTLGPRINAGGRIGESDAAALLLLEEDPERATEMAQALDQLNAQRKSFEKETTEAALAQMADRISGVDRRVAIAVVLGAHEGVVGISAARLREALDAPAIVLSCGHDKNLKGSARSVPGFDIGHAIIEARKAGLIVKGGGHGMAGGLTVEPAKLTELQEFLDAELRKTAYWREGVQTDVDLAVRLADVTVEMIRSFETMRPFGQGNAVPVIQISGVSLSEIRILKEKHLKLTLRDGNRFIDGMVWNCVETPFGQAIQAAKGRVVDVIGELQINAFQGRESAQMIVQDLRFG